jgi:hypothetical protein
MSGTPLLVVGTLGAAIVVAYSLLGKGVALHLRLLYAALRLGALAILAVALSAPERPDDELIRRRRSLMVLLDRSRSMLLRADPRSPATRGRVLEEVLEANAAEFADIASRFDLRTYEFAEGAARQPVSQDGNAPRSPSEPGGDTALGSAMLQAFDETRGARPVGMVVLSDGVSNLGISTEEATVTLSRAGVPVHTIALGTSRGSPDVSVDELIVPRTAAVGKDFPITARLKTRHASAQTISIAIAAGGKAIEQRTVTLRGGERTYDVTTRYSPARSGSLVIEAQASAAAGETVLANNRRLAFVDVDETVLRVVYLEGTLRRDFGALRRALAASSGIELDVRRAFLHRQQMPDVRWGEYDVFVLGEVPDGALPRGGVEAIARLVSGDARGLVVFAGAQALSHTTLRRALPLRIEDASTLDGAKVRPPIPLIGHPALAIAENRTSDAAAWAALGPLDDIPASASALGGAQVLLKAEGGQPVLVAEQTGSGRTAVFASGQTYAWADDPSAPEGAYGRLVRSLVSWAAGRESSRGVISVRLSRHRLRRGDMVSLTAHVNRTRARELGFSERFVESLDLQMRVSAPDEYPSEPSGKRLSFGAPRRLEMRAEEYATSFLAETGGVHRIVVEPVMSDERLEPARSAFVIEESDRDFAVLEARPEELKKISEATGGMHVDARDADKVLKAVRNGPAEVAAVARRRMSLWDRWWIVSLLLAALLSEWWMRRR